MTNLTDVSRLGEVNSAGGSDIALFLKKFGGEVLAAFLRDSTIKQNITQKFAKDGKSAQFPALGRTTAQHHVAGESLYTTGTYLTGINANEIEIFVDRPLIAVTAVDEWDEMVNHYDVRSPYADQMANALAKKIEARLLIVGILGAREELATVTGLERGSSQYLAAGGAKITPNPATGCHNANLLTSGADILAALFGAAQRMTENEVPKSERYFACTPQQYSALVQNQDLLNRDFGGANGIFSDGTVWKAAGFTLLECTTLNTTEVIKTSTTPTGANNVYALTGGKNAGLCFHKSGIGLVTWRQMVMQYDPNNMEYQASIMAAKLSCGAKWLRPECLVELTTP